MERLTLYPSPADKVADIPIPGFPFKVSRYDVACILCAAFEGGSNYWVRRVTGAHPKAEYASEVPSHGGTLRLSFDREDMDEGNGKGRCTLALADVVRGIASALSDKDTYGGSFSMAHVNGDLQDAETADIILQHAVLGRVVYG